MNSNEVIGAIPYTGLIILRPANSKILKGYIQKIITTKFYQFQIELQKTGSTIQHYGPTHLKKIFILLPPIQEQTQIAHFLDQKTQQIDQILQNLQSQIKKLKELRKTLINDVVTGKIKV